MRLIRDSLFISPEDRGAVAAIGNFDGVHLGHISVIDRTREIAQSDGAPLGIVTFEPHPREFFATEAPPFRLMNATARAHRLEKLGVEKLYELPFNRSLSQLSAHEFASVILSERLGLKHVVVGGDFRFGRARAGDVKMLAALGQSLGFDVTVAPLLDLGETQVSSTQIRIALGDGRPRDAARMLGHWHRIEGEVIRGDQRGRDLGYPTANISIAGLHPPKFGVYAVLASVLSGPHAGLYHGAASIGIKPTFGENTPNCETYLFDFKGDLYGAPLSVALVDFLRPEVKFDSLDALIDQMDADSARSRDILSTLRGWNV